MGEDITTNYEIRPVLPALQRIALLSVHTSPLAPLGGRKTGGMNVMVRAISEALGARGIKVDIFTRENDPRTIGQIEAINENARVIYLPAGPPKHLEASEIYRYVPQFSHDVLKFTEKHELKYDVIYSHYWISGAVALTLREAWQVPIVQMFHTLGHMKRRIANTREEQAYQTLIPPPTDQRVTVETQVMDEVDCLIAATHAERVQMLMLYRADRRRIEILPPGVDLKQFRPIDSAEAKMQIGIAPEQKLLIWVGRVEPLKGVDLIVRALAILKNATPQTVKDVVIHVIGGDPDASTPDNQEMQHLQELCTELGLNDLIKFVGAKSPDELVYHYNAADALIMPSDYESFGMVALEAMACGTPVIASEVGGLAFLVEDGVTGFHVPTREPAALAERIYTLLCDPLKHHEMGRAAQEAARSYSWQQIAAQLLEIINDVLLQKHPWQHHTS
jgi:D-inositol-3-phosphate glycosyltransferase